MAAVWPTVEWVGAHSDHFEKGRLVNGKQIYLEGGVNHVAEGSLAGGISWVNASAAERARRGAPGRSSWNYMVGKTGRVIQAVSLLDTAYAHGGISAPKAQLIYDNGWDDKAGYNAPGFISPNKYLYSIEREGFWSERPTPSQLEKIIALHAAIWQDEILPYAAQTGAVVGLDRILNHSDIDAATRARCPSLTKEEQIAIVDGVKKTLGSSDPGPKPSAEYLDWVIAEVEAALEANDDDRKALADSFSILRGEVDQREDTLRGRLRYRDGVLRGKLIEFQKLKKS